MGKGCKSASHQLFKDRAKNRVDDLQGMFSDLQSARRESRATDIAVLEEQVNQMLREWKAELNEASPATSLLGTNRFSSDLSSEIRRLMQLGEEEDDATSKLELLPANLKPEPVDAPDCLGGSGKGEQSSAFQEEHRESEFPSTDQYPAVLNLDSDAVVSNPHVTPSISYEQFNLHQDLLHDQNIALHSGGQDAVAFLPHFSDVLPMICPPATAFLGPKCALWDCPRPTQGSEWCQGYCSTFHATLAFNEGLPGMAPVLRPGGIDLKDGPLFAALVAKAQGKDVGIPQCEGAATAKSPWNAPDLFDLVVIEGESLREWLFFDKPRRAFESGNRKQRSLPDYNGRGWHESRKQVMAEFGGLKRSYYMDPQPANHLEWHLFEYEIGDCDAFALYRLELKLAEHRKAGRAKTSVVEVFDLQQQMGKLGADHLSRRKGRTKPNNQQKENAMSAPQEQVLSSMNENPIFYGPHLPYVYSIETLNGYYGG